MAWRYTKAGKEMSRPDSERGVFVEGPLRSEDWMALIEAMIEEMVEQTKREEREN